MRTKRGLIDQKNEGVCTSFTSNVHQDFTSQYITIHGNAAIIKKEGVYVRTNSFIDSMSGFVFFIGIPVTVKKFKKVQQYE